jgi:hypothetical protein
MVHQSRPSSEGKRFDKRRRPSRLAAAAGLLVAALLVAAPVAFSAQAPVGLGTAGNFAVLAGSTVTNTGPSVISGSVGLDPGSAVTGFPPGIVLAGTTEVATGVALQAKNDLVTAYNDAAGRSSTATVSGDLAGRTLVPGVYTSATTLGLSGNLTLDAQGNPSAVFVFQAGSSLIVNSGQVTLIGGAQACNVYWQVGSSATIGTSSAFVGNILALTSISMKTGATLQGSALARNGAVTLDTNTITRATCATGSGGTVGGGGSTPSGTGTSTGTGTTSAPGTKGTTGASGTTGTTGTKPKPKPKKHKSVKPVAPKAVKPRPRPVKPVTPKPVIPTKVKPPAFTG